MAEALTSIGTIVSTAIGIITDNEYLMIFLVGGLVTIGFTIFQNAKSAASS